MLDIGRTSQLATKTETFDWLGSRHLTRFGSVRSLSFYILSPSLAFIVWEAPEFAPTPINYIQRKCFSIQNGVLNNLWGANWRDIVVLLVVVIFVVFVVIVVVVSVLVLILVDAVTNVVGDSDGSIAVTVTVTVYIKTLREEKKVLDLHKQGRKDGYSNRVRLGRGSDGGEIYQRSRGTEAVTQKKKTAFKLQNTKCNLPTNRSTGRLTYKKRHRGGF